MSKKKGSHLFWLEPGKSKPLCASQPVPEMISYGILILPNNHNSESSVRDNLPSRVLSIHLETPCKIQSLPPILYTAKNAKTVMPEKGLAKIEMEEVRKVVENESCKTKRIIVKVF